MTTLETVEYVDTFRKLKLKHDQEKDRQENKPEMSAAYVFTLSLSLPLPPVASLCPVLFPLTPLISKTNDASSVFFTVNKLGDPDVHDVKSSLFHTCLPSHAH